jgi:hypothetical protein
MKQRRYHGAVRWVDDEDAALDEWEGLLPTDAIVGCDAATCHKQRHTVTTYLYDMKRNNNFND